MEGLRDMAWPDDARGCLCICKVISPAGIWTAPGSLRLFYPISRIKFTISIAPSAQS